MNNKFFKKAATLAMAAAVAAMSVMGAAAMKEGDSLNIINTSKATSLTIYKYDLTAAETAGVDVSQFTADGEQDSAAESALSAYALKGVEFTYLKVGDINTDSQAGALQLLYDLPTGLETILGLSASDHLYTSDEINAALASALSDNTTTKNKLEEYISGQGGTAMATTDTTGKTSASGMAQGLYLVVETKVPEEVHTTTDPFFVSLPMTDATGDYWNYDVVVYPKNQTNNPTIDKLVSENGSYADIATVSEGDVLDYRIVTKLPKITSEATYLTKYTFNDQISSGIAYNKDTYIAFYDSLDDAKNATGTPIATWEAGSGNFSVSYGTDTMTVAMTSDGLSVINPSMSEKYMVVVYKATVQSSAAVVLGDNGNINDVDLTYSRTNTTEENTIEDESRVYTYGINLTKTFSDGKGDATKVQFVLLNTTDGYVTATGSNGVYYVTGTQAADEANATVFSPASDGSLKINGLEADTYSLKEIHTDDGYSLLKEEMTIVINSTVDAITPSVATMTGIDNPNEDVIITEGNRASATVDGNATNMSSDNGSTNGRVDMSVVNTNSFTLPQTGGYGSLFCTLGGTALIIFGFVQLVIKRNEKKQPTAK